MDKPYRKQLTTKSLTGEAETPYDLRNLIL